MTAEKTMHQTTSNVIDAGCAETIDVIELCDDARHLDVRPKSARRTRLSLGTYLSEEERSCTPKIDSRKVPADLERSVRNIELEDGSQTTRIVPKRSRDNDLRTSHLTPRRSEGLTSSFGPDHPTCDQNSETGDGLSELLAARERVLERYDRKRHSLIPADAGLVVRREYSILTKSDRGATRRPMSPFVSSQKRIRQVSRYGNRRRLDPISSVSTQGLMTPRQQTENIMTSRHDDGVSQRMSPALDDNGNEDELSGQW
jgi:hypothetical protein